MGLEQAISQYGPVVGLTIVATLAMIRVLIALGVGQAAKMTAAASSIQANAEVIKAEADSQRVEAETQRDMNSMARQMFEQQRISNEQFNRQAENLKQVEVKMAGLLGEYTAYQKMEAERSASWIQQSTMAEELRQLEKKNAERLEAEFNKLRVEMELALVALNAANAISEERRKENEELKIINSGLEEDKGDLYTKMQGLAEKLTLMEQENATLRELPARVQELEQKNAKLQERIAALEGEVESKHEDQPELA